MRLNTLKAAPGAKHAKKRVGRGIGSGLGKTCGRGHKGQTSRAGGFHKVGFEGGQMPLQRRLPKFGFNSHLAKQSVEIRLHELMQVLDERVSLETLRQASLISTQVKKVKVILSGKIEKPVILVGISVTTGAKKAIEAAGGRVEA